MWNSSALCPPVAGYPNRNRRNLSFTTSLPGWSLTCWSVLFCVEVSFFFVAVIPYSKLKISLASMLSPNLLAGAGVQEHAPDWGCFWWIFCTWGQEPLRSSWILPTRYNLGHIVQARRKLIPIWSGLNMLCALAGHRHVQQCLKFSPPLSGATQNWWSWIGRKGLEWPMCSQMAVPLLARCFGIQWGQWLFSADHCRYDPCLNLLAPTDLVLGGYGVLIIIILKWFCFCWRKLG